jgi:hypothetical protein
MLYTRFALPVYASRRQLHVTLALAVRSSLSATAPPKPLAPSAAAGQRRVRRCRRVLTHDVKRAESEARTGSNKRRWPSAGLLSRGPIQHAVTSPNSPHLTHPCRAWGLTHLDSRGNALEIAMW